MKEVYLTPSEAAQTLSDQDFISWYRQSIKSSRDMYWNPHPATGIVSCDRCNQAIATLEEMRLMQGRRLHHVCFEETYTEWLLAGKAKGYVDPDAKVYFERVIALF